MKRVLFSLMLLAMIAFVNAGFAQTGKPATAPAQNETTAVDTVKTADTVAAAPDTLVQAEAPAPVKKSGTQMIKKYFIDGGGFMFPILLFFILGLAISIEKIITLNMKTVNTKKLLDKIEGALKENKVEDAQEICRSTRGAIASIFYQAFLRRKEGLENVEKAVVSYGSVQMGLLEKGLIWISLMIALAPMLGFMGTVVGMIGAFDAIEAAGDISPSLVAGGIKVALLTTVGGLIAAVILQVFYNYLVAKIDGIVNDMEDASISLVDMFEEYNVTKK